MSAPSVDAPGRDARILGATTVPGMLFARAAQNPTGIALRKKELGRWKEYSWGAYAEAVARVAAGLRSLGVQAGDRVAIQSDNRPAWVIADLAVQALGAVTVGVYPTSPPAELEYLLTHSGSVVLIAEDEEQYDKAMEVRERCPSLRATVVVDTRGVHAEGDAAVLSWDELEAAGAGGSVEALTAEAAALDPSSTAIIVYTSGTTGPPKGVMLSHRNLMVAAANSSAQISAGPKDEVLSYLPLSHIAERIISVIAAVAEGYLVNFGEGGDLFLTDLMDVQPTFFLGVPRVWEKMMAGVEMRMADASWLKKASYRFWQKRGTALGRNRMKGKLGVGGKVVYGIGWLFVYRPTRKKLGLLRARNALSGAAPVSPRVLEWFWAMGVPVREVYGQTENTAQATMTPADDVRIGTVGKALPGVEIVLAPDGEILTRSAGNFVGYFNDPDATAAVLDAEGWLHTGDVGELDADGFLTITDRKKDLIITAGGKNIAPSEIENKLKVSPFVKEAIVIGDGRKYLTALIGIELDTVAAWAASKRITYTTYEDLSAKPEVVQLVGAAVEEVNTELAQVETIKAYRLLPKELDQEDGEVTATQKVRRAAIAKEFGPLIETMYSSGAVQQEASPA